MSKDPIGLFGGLNSKIYVKDPNQWVDTMGLMADYAWTDGNGSFSRTKDSKHKYAADRKTITKQEQMDRQAQINAENRQKMMQIQNESQKTQEAWNASAQSMNEINKQQSRGYGSERVLIPQNVDTPWVPPSLPQEVVDFSAGVGDILSFGATDYIRDKMGTNGVVDKDSYSYGSGQATGVAVGMMTGVGAAASARGVGTVAQIGTTNVLKASAISSVTGQVYTCNCDYASVNINTPIGSVGTTINLLSPDVFGSIGGSASNVAEPAGKAIAKAIGLPTKHVEKSKPASLSVTFGKVENIDPRLNRGNEVSLFLDGKAYNTTVTAPVIGITGGYTFPGQTIDEGKDPFKEKYATERGWSMGGGGIDTSVSGSVKIIGKGGWYDPSDKNK